MAINLSVRLDDDTERKLDELVKTFQKSAPPGMRVKRSDIVRAAIGNLYDLGEQLEAVGGEK